MTFQDVISSCPTKYYAHVSWHDKPRHSTIISTKVHRAIPPVIFPVPGSGTSFNGYSQALIRIIYFKSQLPELRINTISCNRYVPANRLHTISNCDMLNPVHCDEDVGREDSEYCDLIRCSSKILFSFKLFQIITQCHSGANESLEQTVFSILGDF